MNVEVMERIQPAAAAAALGTLLGLAVLLAPRSAAAHAVVYPAEAPPGAYQRYVLRVPNERDVATTRVTLEFPRAVRVVSFAEVPGWTLETETDEEGRVTRATWTGTLPVGRFVELPFIAVNPEEETRLVWPATQTYASGDRVAWTGPEDSATPASVTHVRAAEDEPGTGPAPLWLALAAAVLSLIALGLALRPDEA